jgi:hypothetical protein
MRRFYMLVLAELLLPCSLINWLAFSLTPFRLSKATKRLGVYYYAPS